MKARILIAEDDAVLREGLTRALAHHGYAPDAVADGHQAAAQLHRRAHAAAILDLGLPGRDGLEVLREARAAGIDTPVLILTARDRPEDRVRGLDTGADDYLVKPFDLAELLARVRALLRRGGTPAARLHIGRLSLDSQAREVRLDDRAVTLTPSEFELLSAFADKPRTVLTREQLEGVLASGSRTVGSNALDVHIHNLRRKLSPALIRTVHGVGYRLDPDGEA